MGLETEYGLNGAFRIPDVKCYDYDGKEIQIPICENCGNAKGQILGKEAFVWICMICDENGKSKYSAAFIYRPPNV